MAGPYRGGTPHGPRVCPAAATDCDQLLTNVTVYWLTATAGSSAGSTTRPPAPATGGRRPPRPCPPGSRLSPARSPRGSAVSPSSPTTSCTGPSSTAAATSPPWNNPASSLATSARSSVSFADTTTQHPTGQRLPGTVGWRPEPPG